MSCSFWPGPLAHGQRDRRHDRHQQDHGRDLERIQVLRVEQLARARACWNSPRAGVGRPQPLRRPRPELAHPDHEADLRDDDQRDQRAERRIPREALAQLRDVDVEHHHDEEPQHHDRADVDDDQRHGEKLRLEQQPDHGAVEERGDQEQRAVHRIARRDDAERGRDQDRAEGVEEDVDDHAGCRLVDQR